MGSLTLFPIRVPIGTVTDSAGNSRDVLMTPEFSRALSAVFERIGGTSGMSTTDILAFSEQVSAELKDMEVSAAFNAPPATPAAAVAVPLEDAGLAAQVMALRAELAEVRAELAMARPPADLSAQLEEIRVQLGMVETSPGIVKGTATGSRAANAALASLLTALAKSGLVIDSTTV